jgi:hypothetical protein
LHYSDCRNRKDKENDDFRCYDCTQGLELESDATGDKHTLSRATKVSMLPNLEVKFKWWGRTEVKPTDSKVIIKVPRHQDLDQILLEVASKYAERFMFSSTHLIDQQIRDALVYFVNREMIMALDNKLYPESHSLLNRFYDSTSAITKKKDSSMGYVFAIEDVKERGFLEMLLTTYSEVVERTRHEIPKDHLLNETRNIFKFVLSIARRGRKDAVLMYKGIVSLGVILVDAKSFCCLESQFQRIQSYVDDGIDMIFLVAAGVLNCKTTKAMAESFERGNHEKWAMMVPIENKIPSLEGRLVKSICILLKKRHRST